MMNSKNLGEIGPFFDEAKLKSWLEELAKRLSHAAVILVSNHKGQDLNLLLARAHYLEVVNAWTAKYLAPAMT